MHLLLSMLKSLFIFPWVYLIQWTWQMLNTSASICVRVYSYDTYEWGERWTGEPQSCRPTLGRLNPRDGTPLQGWALIERRASPFSAGALQRPAPFHLPISSGCPTTNHQWRSKGRKHRKRKKREDLARGRLITKRHFQLEVIQSCLSKFGWHVNITFFPLSYQRLWMQSKGESMYT